MTAALLALNERTFASLKLHRNYRLFFTGQVISVSGTWMQNVALAWLVVELTHSPLAVGLLAFCRFIPFTIFGLVAGVVADRIDNRKLVIGTQTVSMIFSAAFAVLVLGGLETLWVVYLLAILSSTALVFDAPGRHALTFQMVGREELPNAVALNASLFNASRVVGPAMAGVLIAAFGVGVCFAINTATFLAVLAGLLMMRREELVPVQRSAEPPTMMRGIREGLGWVRRSPDARLVLTIVTVVSTVGFNFHVILPLLASDTLNTGPEVFGVLSACFGGGALVGALLSAALGRASWKVLVLGTGGFSVCLLALAPLAAVVPCAILLFARRRLLHALDVERELAAAAARARPPARPCRQSLPVGLRRPGAARRPPRRLALLARRHAAQLRGRRNDRPPDGRGGRSGAQPTTGDSSGVSRGSAPGSGSAPSSSGHCCSAPTLDSRSEGTGRRPKPAGSRTAVSDGGRERARGVLHPPYVEGTTC